MTKSGRTLDVTDVDGRAARRRRRSRIRGVIGMVAAGIVAVSSTFFSVVLILSLKWDQSSQDAYDRAPYCAAGTTDTTSCVLRTTARVGSVDVSKNTGKNAHGYTTRVYLEPSSDIAYNQTVKLSDEDDLSGWVASGDVIPVLVWQAEITRFTFSGTTRNADQNPHNQVAEDLGLSTSFTVVAVAFGRPLIRRLQRDRLAINLQRNRVPDWTLVVLVILVMPMAAVLRATDVVVATGWAGSAVLVGSVGWPFIPWVATVPDRQRPLGGALPGNGTRKRNQTKAKARTKAAAKKKLP